MKEKITEIKECPIHGMTEFIFYKSSSHKGQFKCKKCSSENALLQKQKNKLEAVEYKGGKCEICGYNKNIAALEFHHLDPSQKDFTISDTSRNKEKLKIELDKCILVCANCHRELHNPQSTFDNINKLIQLHKSNVQLKNECNKKGEYKYKFTLQEVEAKRLECNNWQEVADFYGISLATLKRHRKELKEISN